MQSYMYFVPCTFVRSNYLQVESISYLVESQLLKDPSRWVSRFLYDLAMLILLDFSADYSSWSVIVRRNISPVELSRIEVQVDSSPWDLTSPNCRIGVSRRSTEVRINERKLCSNSNKIGIKLRGSYLKPFPEQQTHISQGAESKWNDDPE
jgi:hypothetical protein